MHLKLIRLWMILVGLIWIRSIESRDECHCWKKQHCADVPWAKFQEETGLYWAWASPCSGACSQLPLPLPSGWRYATPEEWDFHPTTVEFFGWTPEHSQGQIRSPNICAAYLFDPKYDHCDYGDFIGGYVTSRSNDNNFETLLVHDCETPREIQTTPAPTCKDPCTQEMCEEDAASGQRECTADGIEVDPFNCGGHRCGKVKCTDCGPLDECIAKCRIYKLRKEIKGPPSCKDECEAIARKSGQSDWLCLQRCQFGDVPICREMCSKNFCRVKGPNQLCSAQDMLVDPLRQADQCQTSRCDHCGAQRKCVSLCTAYNDESGADLKCAEECSNIVGYKCFNEYTDRRK